VKLSSRKRNKTSLHAQIAPSNLAKETMKQRVIMQWKEIS